MTYKPFTYLIGWSKHNKWYYGSRTSKNCHPDDLWETYFTSSKYVKQFREEHGEPDVIEIRKIFDCKEKCIKWESKFLGKIDAVNSNYWLNKHIPGQKFIGTSFSEQRKHEYSIKFSGKNNPRFGVILTEDIKNKIKVANLGKKHSEDSKQKMSISRKGRKAWNKGIPHTEETKQKMKGRQNRLGKNLSEESKLLISEKAKERFKDKTNHPRYGKISGFSGKAHSPETILKMKLAATKRKEVSCQ